MNLMNQLLWVAEKNGEFDPNDVTPGVAGFIMVAVLAVAIIFLGFNLVGRLRRNAYRAEIREDIASELAEGEAQDAEPRD